MSALGAAARAYYRLLLLVYPREFRRRDGSEAALVFGEACRESSTHGGLLAVLRRLLHASVEVPRRGLAERVRHVPGGSTPPARRPRRARAVTLLAELAADLRFAARSLRRRPGWTAAIVATLALGIGANTAIFSVIEATLLAASPWPDSERMVLVSLRLSEGDLALDPSVHDLLRWRDEVGVFERLEARESRVAVLSHDAGARRVPVFRVTPGYFDALGVEPLAGRFLRADDARADASPVAVMPEGIWRRLYGGRADVVGKTLQLDGVVHVVVGVAPEVPGVAEAFIKPLPTSGAAARDVTATGYAWLRPGISLPEAAARFAAASTGEHERWGPYVGELRPPGNVFWDHDEFRSGLLALMAAVSLVLGIACVNVANLLLAAVGVRGGELALRTALGAGRARLVRFLMAESLLLSVIGGLAGVVVAHGCIDVMRRMAPGGQLGDALDRVGIDVTVLGYAVLVVLLAGLTFGILPALRAATRSERGTLQEADPRCGGGSRIRGAMVALETALSLVLLVAAGLTLRSFVDLRFADPGFDADRILSVWITLPEARYTTAPAQHAFYDSLRTQSAQLPGIEAVSLGAGAVPPSDLVTGGELTIAGRDASVEAFMTLSMVEGGFLDFMGIPLLAGRDLNDADLQAAGTAPERPVVINRALAQRFWPEGDAVGARFRMSLDRDERWNRVVGIAANVRQRGLESPADVLHIYQPIEFDGRYAQLMLRTRPGVKPPIAEVRAIINRLDAQIPTDELEAAAAGMLASMSNTRFRAALFSAFGAVALVLAAVGIFGVVAYSVVQRTAEMGIRLALGAEPRDVRRLMVLYGGRPVLIGIATGLPIAVGVTRLMSGFLVGVATTDPLTYAATATVLVAVGMLATWLPARRATRVDPVMTLRRG